MGQCAFNNKDDKYIGMLGMHGTKTASMTLAECDLMIVMGSRFSDRVSCNASTFAKNTKIIHIEIDPAEINKNIHIDAQVTGDIAYILGEFNKRIPQQSHSEWLEQVYEWKKEYPLSMHSDDEEEILPSYVLQTIDKLTDGKAVLSTEVGQHQMWTAEFYDFAAPRSLATSGGLGTMGYGLGAAIGAKCGNPDKTVFNIAGDGSFYMNLNELSTLAKYNLPVIELVLNNSVLGMVRQWQKLFYGGRFSQTNLEKNTDFEMLGKAFGINAFTITKKSEVEPTIRKAIELNAPVLINCCINKDINVLPMVPAGASVYEPILEM